MKDPAGEDRVPAWDRRDNTQTFLTSNTEFRDGDFLRRTTRSAYPAEAIGESRILLRTDPSD